MKLVLRRDLGGYALPQIVKTKIDGTVLDKPFVLFTGPNGSGKSAVLRGIRASIGLRNDRAGQIDTPCMQHLDPEEVGPDVEALATTGSGFDGEETASHVPVVFKISDLGWKGNPTHLFDSRTTSSLANAPSFTDDADMLHHISMIAGGGSKASHGQFVSKAWWEAIEWAVGATETIDPWKKQRPSAARAFVLEKALGGEEPSTERWLLIDEPETAIDVQTLVVGLAVLLKAAEIGRLRVLCASHSLLFASALCAHPKVQTVDLGEEQSWLSTQRLAMKVADDAERMEDVGTDVLTRIMSRKKNGGGSSRRKATGRKGATDAEWE